MDDIRAVLDAVGCERAALLGFSEGAALSVLFAASHPERTSGLILYDSVAVGAMADEPDPNWVKSSKIILDTLDRWGEGETMKWIAPSLPGGGAQQRFWGAFERAAASPGMARGLWEAIQRADVRPVMPMISVPTLVLHHAHSSIPNSQGRLLAERIPGARYVELPGRDHIPGAGDPEAIAGEIEEFLTGTRATGQPDRVLATVLFTDIVDSTRRAAELGDSSWRELRERHDALVRSELDRFGGREVKQTGDGFLASFDGPARAIRCACSIRTEARELGIDLRAGLHTGECERIGDDLAGVAVHVAARVGAEARSGEVLVSSTVKDLVMGSAIDLTDRGAHELKGVPGEWRLFAVGTEPGEAPVTPPQTATDSGVRPDLTERAVRRLARSAPGLMRATARVMQRRSTP
jgi:class 3 adenylate cyclase